MSSEFRASDKQRPRGDRPGVGGGSGLSLRGTGPFKGPTANSSTRPGVGGGSGMSLRGTGAFNKSDPNRPGVGGGSGMSLRGTGAFDSIGVSMQSVETGPLSSRTIDTFASSSIANAQSTKSKIRILVCSSNLGNAKPDIESLNEWIPMDGFCRHVPGLPKQQYRDKKDETPKYPIMLKPPANPNPEEDGELPTLEKRFSKHEFFVPQAAGGGGGEAPPLGRHPMENSDRAIPEKASNKSKGGVGGGSKGGISKSKKNLDHPMEISLEFDFSLDEDSDEDNGEEKGESSSLPGPRRRNKGGEQERRLSNSSTNSKKKRQKQKSTTDVAPRRKLKSKPAPKSKSASFQNDGRRKTGGNVSSEESSDSSSSDDSSSDSDDSSVKNFNKSRDILADAPSNALMDGAKATIQVLRGTDLKKENNEINDDYEKYLAEQAQEQYFTPTAEQAQQYDSSIGDSSGGLSRDDDLNNATGGEAEDYEAFLAKQQESQDQIVDAPVELGDDPYAMPPSAEESVPLGDDPYAAPSNPDDDYEAYLKEQANQTQEVILGEDPYAAPEYNIRLSTSTHYQEFDNPFGPPKQDKIVRMNAERDNGNKKSNAVRSATSSNLDSSIERGEEDDDDSAEDEYAKFLDKQKKKTLWGFMESEEGKGNLSSSKPNLNHEEGNNSSSDGEFDDNSSSKPPSSMGDVGFAPSFPNPSDDEDGNDDDNSAVLKKSGSVDSADPFNPTTTSTRASIINDLATGDAVLNLVDFGDDGIEVQGENQMSEQDKQRFDIIVIGMQEATFKSERDEVAIDDLVEDGTLGDDNTISDDGSHRGINRSFSDSIQSFGSMDLDSDDPSSDFGNRSKIMDATPLASNKKLPPTTISVTETDSTVSTKTGTTAGSSDVVSSSKKNKLTKVTKIVGKATGKAAGGVKVAGKATMYLSKLGLKAGKKVVSTSAATGKTAKTLLTSKDHTNSSLPTPQQASGPMLDGGMADWSDTHQLHYLLEDQLPSYKRALSFQQGEMRLIIYYQESAVDLELLSVKAKNTGKGGLANKGGIVAEVNVNQSTRLAFATAHLEAHEGNEKYATRCSSVASILRGTESSATPCKCDASMASHFMFFMGDLNFRTRLTGYEPGSDEHIEATHELVGSTTYADEKRRKMEEKARKDKEKKGDEGDESESLHQEGDDDVELVDLNDISQSPSAETDIPDDPPPSCYYPLNQADELAYALKIKECFVGFRTPYCNFPPTFKVGRQLGYKYNPKRSPSYTDRILYKTSDQLESALTPILYEPVNGFVSSDHKPIRGAYDILLNPKLQWKPATPPEKIAEM